MYYYSYTDPFGKRRYIYSKDLLSLREKEEQLKRDQLDGIDTYVAGNADLNFMFDRYMATKTELRVSTRSNYLEVYDRYVRNEFGKKKLVEIKYSDILFFYNYLITDKDLHIGTVQYIQRLIRPSLEMAVRDNIIRKNPANGIIQQLKKIRRQVEHIKDMRLHLFSREHFYHIWMKNQDITNGSLFYRNGWNRNENWRIDWLKMGRHRHGCENH